MNAPTPSPRRLFAADVYEAVQLAEEDLPALQAFFVSNPGYFLAVTGAPPRPDEAKQEFEFRPPPGLPYDKVCVLGFFDSSGRMVAMASVLTDFLAPRVWHISLFIVATALHGTGTAGLLYGRFEKWAKDGGASWLRLGAVVGNVQAERFWEKVGYKEIRRAPEQLGSMTHTTRVMVKGGAHYLTGEIGEDQRDEAEQISEVGPGARSPVEQIGDGESRQSERQERKRQPPAPSLSPWPPAHGSAVRSATRPMHAQDAPSPALFMLQNYRWANAQRARFP